MIQRKKIISSNEIQIGLKKVDVIVVKNYFFSLFDLNTTQKETIVIVPYNRLLWARYQICYERNRNVRLYFYSKDKSNQLSYFDKRLLRISKSKKAPTNPLTVNISQGYWLNGVFGLKGDFIYRHRFDPKFSDAYLFKQQMATKKK